MIVASRRLHRSVQSVPVCNLPASGEHGERDTKRERERNVMITSLPLHFFLQFFRFLFFVRIKHAIGVLQIVHAAEVLDRAAAAAASCCHLALLERRLGGCWIIIERMQKWICEDMDERDRKADEEERKSARNIYRNGSVRHDDSLSSLIKRSSAHSATRYPPIFCPFYHVSVIALLRLDRSE